MTNWILIGGLLVINKGWHFRNRQVGHLPPGTFSHLDGYDLEIKPVRFVWIVAEDVEKPYQKTQMLHGTWKSTYILPWI